MEKKTFTCYLDVAAGHPRLYGHAILPRDDDGLGFTLELAAFKGKFVRITIEEAVPPVDYPSVLPVGYLANK